MHHESNHESCFLGPRPVYVSACFVNQLNIYSDEFPPLPYASLPSVRASFLLVMNLRDAVDHAFAFSFVEGVLVRALKEGHWILLDEINLASAETLQRLVGLLEVSTQATTRFTPQCL